MEQFYSNLEFNNSGTIIGDKDQCLQFVLKRNDAIVLKKSNIYYVSTTELEETVYSQVNSLLHSMDELQEKKPEVVKVKDNNLVRLKNTKNNFEYLGLFNGGI
jgi:hypothetical protein